MRQGTWLSYVGRGGLALVGIFGLMPNLYFLLFPIASIMEGYLVPSPLYLARLALLVAGLIVSVLLIVGAVRGWRFPVLLILTALLVAEYVVIRTGLLN